VAVRVSEANDAGVAEILWRFDDWGSFDGVVTLRYRDFYSQNRSGNRIYPDL
jgi:hypothetical protein